METKLKNAVIRLEKGDITETEADAFVFDITSDLKLGSGYGGAIAVRGGKTIQEELDTLGTCPTGEAVVTAAGELKAKFIIHVNGPKFHEPDTETKLAAATRAALRLADEKGVKKLAFPPIGTGLYQVPLDLCARVMIDTVAKYLEGDSNLEEVVFYALDSRELEPFKARMAKGE